MRVRVLLKADLKKKKKKKAWVGGWVGHGVQAIYRGCSRLKKG
jgi:hypothetical protein